MIKEQDIVEELLREGLVTEEDLPLLETFRPERLARMYEVLNERTHYISLILEAVDDGHNQAAILRSADAFGIQKVSIVTGRAPFQPNRKVTQGAHKWLTIQRYPDISTAIRSAQREGYQVLASHLAAEAVPITEVDLSRPTVFLFGNEHDGVSPEALQQADGNFVIPMYGFVQSFNVSVACAITLSTVTYRARQLKGEQYFLTKAEKRKLYREWLAISSPRVRRMLAGLKAVESDLEEIEPDE